MRALLRWPVDHVAGLLGLLLIAAVLGSCSPPAYAQVPAACLEFRQEMTRSAFRVFGPGAPIADLAAQIQQESSCRVMAESRVGAQGLAQFMPATAQDMADRHPADCAPPNPFNPRWAFACRDRYVRALLAAQRPLGTGPSLDDCSRWAFAFRAYNGGLGWINRDRRLAASAGFDPDDWHAVRPVNAGRSVANWRENVEYPERIYRLAPRYVAAGWGTSLGCSHD